jgi:hypothetical protein
MSLGGSRDHQVGISTETTVSLLLESPTKG